MVGSPPPLDLAYQLPTDWRDRLRAVQPRPHEAPLVQLLQRAVAALGERSILVEDLQCLAVAAAGCDPGEEGRLLPVPVSRATHAIYERVGAEWPLRAPIDEQFPSRLRHHPYDLARRLFSIEVEWLVLESLINAGWTPEMTMRKGQADWVVEQRGRRLVIEVKSKSQVGIAADLLGWAVKGLALLAQNRFMLQYCWNWENAEGARDREARSLMDWLVAVLPELRLALPELEGSPKLVLPRDVSAEHFVLETDSRATVWIWPPRSIGRCNLALTPAPSAVAFNAGGGRAYWLERPLSETHASQFREKVLQPSLKGLLSKGRTHSQAAVHVVVWWVPYSWMEAMEASWLRDQLDAMAPDLGNAAVAVFPVGCVSGDVASWVMNAAAHELLSA